MFVTREGTVEDATVSNKAGDVLETNVSKVNNMLGHVQWGDIRLLLTMPR